MTHDRKWSNAARGGDITLTYCNAA